MNNRGSSLIEFMTYIALVIFLMSRLIPWSITAFSLNNRTHSKINQMVDCSVMHDLFVKDIFNTSCQKNTWIVTLPHALLWKKEDGTHVGWSYNNNNIYRTTGLYSTVSSQWIKKHTDLLFTYAERASFIVEQGLFKVHSISLDIILDSQHYFFTGASRYAYT